MTIARGDRFSVAHDVHVRSFNEELVVLDLACGEYFSLDGVGSRVWESLGRGQSVADTAKALADEYDADVAGIELDVCRLVEELVARHLLVPASASVD